nr:PREDICTED: uncharacterized protein LOC106704139 [Latimeria chalumnae]|eukprot:XP_014345948.1 PREDICTED: uncharacterized protein LOC106704139 [Latimeria chalumnae]
MECSDHCKSAKQVNDEYQTPEFLLTTHRVRFQSSKKTTDLVLGSKTKPFCRRSSSLPNLTLYFPTENLYSKKSVEEGEYRHHPQQFDISTYRNTEGQKSTKYEELTSSIQDPLASVFDRIHSVSSRESYGSTSISSFSDVELESKELSLTLSPIESLSDFLKDLGQMQCDTAMKPLTSTLDTGKRSTPKRPSSLSNIPTTSDNDTALLAARPYSRRTIKDAHWMHSTQYHEESINKTAEKQKKRYSALRRKSNLKNMATYDTEKGKAESLSSAYPPRSSSSELEFKSETISPSSNTNSTPMSIACSIACSSEGISLSSNQKNVCSMVAQHIFFHCRYTCRTQF